MKKKSEGIPREGKTNFKSITSRADRGLKQDKGDGTRWKHDRDRMVGYDYAGEFNQYKPFFFSANVMLIILPLEDSKVQPLF